MAEKGTPMAKGLLGRILLQKLEGSIMERILTALGERSQDITPDEPAGPAKESHTTEGHVKNTH